MTARRALVTGGGGQLASDLEELLQDGWEAHALARTELDITDAEAVERALVETSPQVVFNCAAFHNVDLCEREEEQALAVNVTAVGRLARACAKSGAKLVHMSTNYVFDGDRPEPYSEDDLPAPRSVYAIPKLAGEHAALAYGPEALVVRTAGLYGLNGSRSKGGNFVTRALDRARTERRLRMVVDQRLTPTFTADLASGVVKAVERRVAGVLHLTNSGACSWYEFTQAILEEAGLEVPVEPFESHGGRGGDGALRPLNGVLETGRAEAAALDVLRDWRTALADYMARAGLAASRQGAS